MVRRLVVSALVLASLGCGQPPHSTPDAGGPGGPDAGGFTGTGARVTFCEVQQLLQARCWSCHGTTPLPGAPQLVTKADLLASAPRGGTFLDRSILRLQEKPIELAMPPNEGGTEAEVNLLIDFRASQAPDCGSGSLDAGTPPVLTCTSGRFWGMGNMGAEWMNPGEACISCHRTRRFSPLYGFMGTVYPTAHEQALCMATNIPAGTAVEILDANGAVRLTLPVNASWSGNFFGGAPGAGPSPYRARVVVNGQVRSEMRTLQTNGDCNACHTPTGRDGAPGRVHW